MMKKTILLFALLLLLPISLSASKADKLRAANWCFGYSAWMDFNTGTPVNKSGCQLATFEGVATMSDTGGNLLFYTDGTTVYNKNHQVMDGGTGLYGDISSSQSAITFPIPGDTNKYYIATAEAEARGYGLNYSVLDISLNNGLGKVLQKNINLSSRICEKVTAVGHANGTDYWLVTQAWGKNEIQVFLVNKDNISLKHQYPTTIFPNFQNSANTKGYMKFSPDGTKLASGNCGIGLFLYDFDNATGKLSNEMSWKSVQFRNTYGVEFSPSGRFLYSASPSYMRGVGTLSSSCLIQLDVSSGSYNAITNSLKEIDVVKSQSESAAILALQLAIDGKIYLAHKAYNGYSLGVINKPDSSGSACDFNKKGFDLSYGRYDAGLPQSIQSFFNIKPGTVDFDDCEGGTIVLDAEVNAGYSYNWTGPQGLNVNAAHHEINPTTRAHSGTYTLTVKDPDGTTKTFDYDITIKYVNLEINLINTADITSETGIKSNDQYFSIKNNTPFEVVITNAYLKKGDKFKLNPISLPLTIAANSTSTTDISCYLFSDITGIFDDSLIVEVTEPCQANIATYMEGTVIDLNASATADDCEGGTLILDVEENAGYSYNWAGPQGLNINAAHHEINPTTRDHSGTYTLTVTAPDGTQTTVDYNMTIKYLDLEINLINGANVTSETGIKSNDQFFSIKNNTPFEVVITNAYLKKGDKFKLNPISLPLTIAANSTSTTDISCYLFSDITGIFDDSLIVEVTEPCPAETAAYMEGTVTKYEPLIVYVHLPDTTAEVGAVIRMPLKAKLNKPLSTGTTLDLKITWHYLAKGYSPMYYQTFDHQTIFDQNVDICNEYITGSFKSLTLDTVYQKIANVSGYALLCNISKVDLIFDTDSLHSSVSIPRCIIIGENGSITITKPACISPDITMNPDITHAASPAMMPISDDATIKLYSPDTGELKLTVYSINGQIIEQFSYLNSDAPFYKEITLDVNKYSNGVYCLTWQSNKRTFSKTILINR